MYICHGPHKTMVHMRASPACTEAMDLLLHECRKVQRKKGNDMLWLNFGYDQLIPLTSDETLMMAVEMCVRYWFASCDKENTYPDWMHESDETMMNECSFEDSDDYSDFDDMYGCYEDPF